ncbi:MAG: hypothetical protein KME05_21720 [Gloeocapsa sp. UFS-A4-WI-NPMV-4B04]|nr:hypothetical protein [Gloeocapsa sp. UFS-A4-WI-NPMV-4B04]
MATLLPEIILLNVRWYCRYALSYRDLEEMMAERGVEGIEICPRTRQTDSSSQQSKRTTHGESMKHTSR